MKPRRLALLIATLAGLVPLAWGVWRWTTPPPRHDMHERWQVEFEQPPVEAALWFASRYPQYFRSGEAGLEPWLDSLDPRDRDFVLAMAQTLTWAWVEHELAGMHGHDPETLALAATRVIRHKTINQLELNVDHYDDVEGIVWDAYVGAPEFGSGVFARLIRGFSNCEGQNHLLAVLLEQALRPSVAGLPKIDVLMAGVAPGHELVRLEGLPLTQPIYVDAWSNLPPFRLDPARPGQVPSLSELGPKPVVVVPGAASREPFSVDVYAHSGAIAIELVPPRDAPRKQVDLEIRAPALDAESLARVDLWRLYAYARVLHLYDDPRAAAVYRLVQERDCDDRPKPHTFFCAASTVFLQRLEGG